MMRYPRIHKVLLTALMAILLVGFSTGCKVHKNDFHKKKWKIKKGHPPIQRYYNKWSPFNPHRE